MRRLTSEFCLKCWRARFMAYAAILVATSGAWLGTAHERSVTLPELIRAGKLPAQLSNVPSHNRLYRASLVPSRGQWTLRLEKSDYEPVSDASLAMRAWMPEEPAVNEYQPRVIADGDGVYRVEGLRFDRAGWWNMKLNVTHAGITDSLAFNVIVPSRIQPLYGTRS